MENTQPFVFCIQAGLTGVMLYCGIKFGENVAGYVCKKSGIFAASLLLLAILIGLAILASHLPSQIDLLTEALCISATGLLTGGCIATGETYIGRPGETPDSKRKNTWAIILFIAGVVLAGCGMCVELEAIVGAAHAHQTMLEGSIVIYYLIGYFVAWFWLKRAS